MANPNRLESPRDEKQLNVNGEKLRWREGIELQEKSIGFYLKELNIFRSRRKLQSLI